MIALYPAFREAVRALGIPFADRIEQLLLIAPDETVDALADLRGCVRRDIAARAGSLPRLASFTPPETIPAAVLAYRIYQDTDRTEELVARNHVAHASFVPGGQPIEVLIDG